MRVYPISFSDVLRSVSNEVPMFDYLPTFGNISDNHLMACGNLLKDGNCLRVTVPLHANLFSFEQRPQNHHHIVPIVYFYEIPYIAILIPFALMSFR